MGEVIGAFAALGGALLLGGFLPMVGWQFIREWF